MMLAMSLELAATRLLLSKSYDNLMLLLRE